MQRRRVPQKWCAPGMRPRRDTCAYTHTTRGGGWLPNHATTAFTSNGLHRRPHSVSTHGARHLAPGTWRLAAWCLVSNLGLGHRTGTHDRRLCVLVVRRYSTNQASVANRCATLDNHMTLGAWRLPTQKRHATAHHTPTMVVVCVYAVQPNLFTLRRTEAPYSCTGTHTRFSS